MEYKVLLTVAVAFAFFHSAHSLQCYACSSKEPDKTCASPLNTSAVISINCSDTTTNTFSFFGNDIDPQLLRVANSSQYECIVYEKLFRDNKTQTVRNCVNKQRNFCKLLGETSQIEPYNLTRCYTCDSDNCNSSSSLQISIFLFTFVVGLCACFLK